MSFVKGQSGNPSGRPKGVKGKPLSNKELTAFLGKRTEEYIKCVEELAADPENDSTFRLRAYNHLLNLDLSMRIQEYKEFIDREKLKLDKKKVAMFLKTQELRLKAECDEEVDNVPIFSLTAVK